MRQPKHSGAHQLRAARPTPTYNDEVSEGFIERQNAHIKTQLPANFELTPIPGAAW